MANTKAGILRIVTGLWGSKKQFKYPVSRRIRQLLSYA